MTTQDFLCEHLQKNIFPGLHQEELCQLPETRRASRGQICFPLSWSLLHSELGTHGFRLYPGTGLPRFLLFLLPIFFSFVIVITLLCRIIEIPDILFRSSGI